MPNSGGASAPSTKQAEETMDDVKVGITLNVFFSSLPANMGAKSKLAQEKKKPRVLSTGFAGTKSREYDKRLDIAFTPDKTYEHTSFILCEDIVFDEEFACIDFFCAYGHILEACADSLGFVEGLSIPSEAEVRLGINIVGTDIINDIYWGFAYMIDSQFLSKVKEKCIQDLLKNSVSPLFSEYKKNGWSVSVDSVSTIELIYLMGVNP